MRLSGSGSCCVSAVALLGPWAGPALAQSPLVDLSLEELGNVTLTSTAKREQRLADAAASLFVITADDIRRSGFTWLPEVLRLAPNLHVAKVYSGGYAISARSFNANSANKLRVLIDGRSVYTPLFAGVFWDTQDVALEDVERIEFSSGPGSTLWGVNAVNGVINIITRSEAATRGTLVSAAVGEHEHSALLRHGLSLGDGSSGGDLRLYLKRSDHSHPQTATGSRVQDAGHLVRGSFRADWGSGGNRVTLLRNAYRGNHGQPLPGSINITGVDFALDTIRLSGADLLARWERPPAGGELSVQGYLDRTVRVTPPSFDETHARPERRQEFVEHVVGAGKHLLTLINEILNPARIESGHVELLLEPVLMDDVLAECRQMIEPMASQRGIATAFAVGSGSVALADRMRLKQVLLTLVSKATEYNRTDGSVRVSCDPLGPLQVRITVQDTGLGLQPAQVDALFRPFNHLGQEAGSEQGTGIGLVVTQRLVALMGGQIGVHSTPGEGGLFWVDMRASEIPALPRAATDWGDLADLAGTREGEPPATALYVEDNPASLKLVEELLRTRTDLRLLSATDGSAGVVMARAEQPDVILMDNNMPTMSGREAQAILRLDPRTAHIPVIALTANAMPDAATAALAAGFFRYVTKPLDAVPLMRTLDKALAAARERRSRS